MADLLGPASAANATTTDPGDARVFGGSDSFFKDCSAPGANDGTVVESSFLNGILKQIRRAIRGMGVTEDNADTDMLLKAIQAAGSGYVRQSDLDAYLPIFPVAGAGSLTLTTGQVVVNSSGSNYCVWRGHTAKDATQLTSGQRTFATTANKTYHLRWHRVNGLLLRDLADAAYNPSALAETNSAFDSTYDDALLGKVVTNGSNVPTFTSLYNNWRLDVVGIAPLTVANSGTNTATGTASVGLNWARTPSVLLTQQSGQAVDSTAHENDLNIQATSITRYSFGITMLDDWVSAMSASYHAFC